MAITVGTDSYISLADAESYFETRLHAGNRNEATDTDKEKALKHATRMIDDLFAWPGELTDEDQVLDWPRSDVVDSEGRDIASDAIPVPIENGTCEQALYLLGAIDPTTEPDLIKQGFSKAKLGPMEVETDKTMIPDQIGPAVPIAIGELGSLKPGASAFGVFTGETIRQ